MALSFNPAQLKPQDTVFHLESGEDVSIRFNNEIFDANGQLRQQNGLSATKTQQFFTLVWPKLPASSLSTLSRWQLIISRATEDRITSFYKDTARNLGADNWKTVKNAVADCRAKFHSWLLSISNQEIVFIHVDQESAEKMKESNEMVDIMNSLLAAFDPAFSDILVYWEVKVTPVTVSLSYQPFNEKDQAPGGINNLLFADSESLQLTNSTMSAASLQKNEMPLLLQQILDTMATQNQKTQDALDKIIAETANRHRIVCQKLGEIENSFRKFYLGRYDTEEEECEGQSERENYMTEAETESPEEEEERIPSALLFDGPARLHSPPHQWPQDIQDEPKALYSRQHHDSTTDVLRRDDTVRPSERHKESLGNSHLENENLDKAVERAYEHDTTSPMAKSFYTILCLDISASMMEHGAFEEMKHLLGVFIDGIEDIVTTTGVEENIGVVTFGKTSTVVQNLTNDFARVRDAIDNIELGGRSPFVQALLVSMAAFVDKAGIISICGEYQVRPRIIFFSDGYPTENYDGPQDTANNKMHVRTGLTRLMMNFATKNKYSKVGPVIYVPVGRKPDMDLMKSMAAVSGGKFVEPKDVHKLCSYFLIQETIGKTLSCARSGGDFSDGRIQDLVSGLVPDLNEEQRQEIVKTVQEEQHTPRKKHKNRLSDFEDRYENVDKVNAGELLPLGTRVLRGFDWHWGNQDQEGPGTVFSHTAKNGWTYVVWDHGGHNRYAYGPDMGYEIWKTDDHPRMPEDQELHFGMTVEKGPDWQPEEGMKNLDYVKTGVIIRKSRSQKKLMVRWEDGQMQVVRFGADDKYDVMYCDVTKVEKEAPLRNTYQQDYFTSFQKKAAPAQDFEHGQWQRKEPDGKWVNYSPEHNASIEKIYKRKRDGTCMIHRNGKNRRIIFLRMTEKEIDTGVEYGIQRVPYPA